MMAQQSDRGWPLQAAEQPNQFWTSSWAGDRGNHCCFVPWEQPSTALLQIDPASAR